MKKFKSVICIGCCTPCARRCVELLKMNIRNIFGVSMLHYIEAKDRGDQGIVKKTRYPFQGQGIMKMKDQAIEDLENHQPFCRRLSQSHRKEKRALEAKLEALNKKKKGKGLIGAWVQDSSECEGEEKANLYLMVLENEVQSSPSNISNLVDDNDDDHHSLLIELYHELAKITKKKKELKNKIDNLSNDNSKLVCENKTLFQSLEVLKKEKDFSKFQFQRIILENKNVLKKFSLLRNTW
ncbi:hypothetical protein M9H77_28255 [Catharanthus roseus]|uniref:Uncharacterized protein n=1 Tax=Catharanthus roseus TaxID=4058 RepID=A0ACC0AHH6_CATRO|nr:hypothetical protein M9H77_28255 [Catharanthus roseus]